MFTQCFVKVSRTGHAVGQVSQSVTESRRALNVCFSDRLRNRRGECYLVVCWRAAIYESTECEFWCLYSHSWSVCLGWRLKANNENLSSSLHLRSYIASLPLAWWQCFSTLTAILGSTPKNQCWLITKKYLNLGSKMSLQMITFRKTESEATTKAPC